MRKSFSFAVIMSIVVLFISAGWSRSSAQTEKAKGGGGVAAIFQKDCAKCHGADGKGIKSLDPPDFTNPKWQASKTDKQLIADINNGEGVMPAFKGKLTPAQITALVKHIRKFAPKDAAPPKAAAPKVAPKSAKK
jgi:cytochrome c oxidase cbb3-type subunit 3